MSLTLRLKIVYIGYSLPVNSVHYNIVMGRGQLVIRVVLITFFVAEKKLIGTDIIQDRYFLLDFHILKTSHPVQWGMSILVIVTQMPLRFPSI